MVFPFLKVLYFSGFSLEYFFKNIEHLRIDNKIQPYNTVIDFPAIMIRICDLHRSTDRYLQKK